MLLVSIEAIAMKSQPDTSCISQEVSSQSNENEQNEQSESESANDCFLSRMPDHSAESHEFANASTSKVTAPDQQNKHPEQQIYIDQKPKWWRRQAGRRGTRGQRKCLSRMQQLGYVMERKNARGQYLHGVELNLSDLFGTRPHRMEDVDIVGDDSAGSDIHEDMANNAKMLNNDESSQQMHHEQEYWLEIGIGRGENLLACAEKHPSKRCYIGADVHQPGTCIALQRMESAIKSGKYWDGATLYGESDVANKANASSLLPDALPYDNVRIYGGDGMKLLQSLSSQSLTGIVLPFPDPFPDNGRNSNTNWRVIQRDTLAQLERVLRFNGAFYLATDSKEYFDWCQDIFEKFGTERGWSEVKPCPDRRDWLPVVSYYEEKGIKEERSTMLSCWKFVPDQT